MLILNTVIQDKAALAKKFKIHNGTLMPIDLIVVDDRFIIAIYQGNKSDYDIIVKYRQRFDTSQDQWSALRTPSHIHWLIDVLVKRTSYINQLQCFINKLIEIWNGEITPFDSLDDRSFKISTVQGLYSASINEDECCDILQYGFYSLHFLFCVAVLLMYQEKTNYPDGILFQGILGKLATDTNDLFSIFQQDKWR